jgi:hypothetical protein
VNEKMIAIMDVLSMAVILGSALVMAMQLRSELKKKL